MKLLIDGQWSDAENNETLNKYNPATGKIMGTFPSASRKDVDRAIDAAEESFEKWGEMGSVARSKIIYRAKELIVKSRKELEEILMNENGKIPVEARQEVDGVIDQLQYYAEFARKITGDIVEGDTSFRKIFQYKVPSGVVVALTPWNFPAAMVARKLAPALITGNTVVLKPSSDTPFTAEWIVKKFVEAGVPRGTLNFITGKGSEIGDYIVSHKKVSVVTMTGSTSTGQRIVSKTSANMAKLILELGGKAPFMVWKDADLKNALRSFLWAKFWNTGQSCIAAERLYVHEQVSEKFMTMLVKALKGMKIGNPLTSDMGPLINKSALEITEKFVSEAETRGTKILSGGKRPQLSGEFQNGYFYEPTVFGDVEQDSDLFQEEVFGPVIGSATVSDEDELIAKANDSKYGLASYLFTSDHNLIFKASEKIRFGEVYINMPGPESSQGYHTGFRLTGQAGEGSKYGIEEYLKLKNVYVDYSGSQLRIETVREELIQ
ncbi:MAG: D-glyceraldehyde dehydrogenase [Candidatus Thermoplasmatota archaeon]|nr:D-glyceraldehyde dehydrogenase [Candidatus Thermoplasmatota archaeon]MDA8143332.1 D-glyceraldehyde dehydrogenase [Thermoplasmatales archaeon]